MTLLWKCYDLDDYILIDGDPEEAPKAGGCKINYLTLQGLEGVINAENSSKEHSAPLSEAIRQHEEMHSIEELFPKEEEMELKLKLTSKSKEEEISAAIAQLSRRRIKKFESSAEGKGEILAFLKDKRFSFKKIKELLLKTEEEGGLYDYLSEKIDKDHLKNRRSILKEGIKEVLLKGCGEKIAQNENLDQSIENAIDEAYGNYKKLVSRSIDAASDLAYFYPSPEARNELIGLLAIEPLNKWPRLADRLWENRLEKMNHRQLKDLASKTADLKKMRNLERL